jgi:glycosyltransferase involved in cell wall biosynthesis
MSERHVAGRDLSSSSPIVVKSMPTISVVIPTYKRPEMLRNAVRSVVHQKCQAREIIVVWRHGDDETRAVIESEIAQNPRGLIRDYCVDRAGFLPPVRLGISNATSDIVAFLDDDAVAHPDWLQMISRHYADPAIGGVGGRCVEGSYPPAKVAARLTWYGRSIGNMYKDAAFSGWVSADFLMGGNMSFLRSALQKVVIDENLSANVASHWELDVTQQVKRQGYRVVYDPGIKTDHFTGPREIIGGRSPNDDGIYWSNYNYSYLMKKYLPRWRLMAFVVFTFLIGSSGSPGLLWLIYKGVRHGRKSLFGVGASVRGRLRGLAS